MSYNPYSLEGKTILVTGASSGIGKATAIECSKLGARVVITGRDMSRLEETFSLLEGREHSLLKADLSSEDGIRSLVKDIPEIDGLVNAAGMVKTIPFPFITKRDIEEVFDINFYAPTLLSKYLIKAKRMSKGASIVFLSSIDGPVTAHHANSIYAASKGAVSAMAKSMAMDLVSKKIRVNCVLPGMTETPLIHGEAFTDDDLEKDKSQYPLKRYGRPEEIAWAIIYFLSDASGFTTGASLVVDGGFTVL
ncbi:3-oxoacyl-ACP reductase [Parabacteroides distasonis]|uniref:3-oxoacyl-ACP reductase n=1 Tax=Parabacteroides distasonis TaxID=823 RepID=A0A1Y4HZU8_PARDI|nr:SDR family oxidoreductase [Parabacteroides distasonis]OUP13567.1 3-oxoacyl-ACP reductase [Parabacteroides distasonis]